MQSSFRIASIAGVDIGINPSWLGVFALIAFSLAAAVFPQERPGLPQSTYVVMAIVAAVLFFVSLIAHELGHAVTARREGMEIGGITLWLFGGVAAFKGQFPSAGAEFRIAVAGPLVSLVIGGGLTALGLAVAFPAPVDAVVTWLGYINLILLAFNLLPALPLDGGRIARAALWHFRGDFRSATRIAAGLGRGFGQLMIFGGLLLVLFAGALGGIWLALIGFFLMSAADQEGRLAEASGALGGLRVVDVMVRDPVSVPPDMTIRRFMDEVFLAHRHASYPVVEHGRTLGLAPVRRLAAVPREQWDVRRVGEAMVPVGEALVMDPARPLADALGDLAASPVGRALVCSGGRLQGLLSMTDVARLVELRSGARPGGAATMREPGSEPLLGQPGR
jgi:Zn-dependent protease